MKVSMPFITGYISNKVYISLEQEKKLFQCPLSRATFQTDVTIGQRFLVARVSMPFITGYISNGIATSDFGYEEEMFQCPLSRATFQTLSEKN